MITNNFGFMIQLELVMFTKYLLTLSRLLELPFYKSIGLKIIIS